MSPVGLSLAQLEIARAVQGVDDLVARTNKRLADNDQPPLPRAFYTAAEMDAVLARHAEELEALRPKKPESAWENWRERQSQAKPGESSYASFGRALTKARGEEDGQGALSAISPAAALDMVAVALMDDRLSLPALREALGPIIRLARRPPPSDATLQHISSWLDATVAVWPAPDADAGELAIDGDENDDLELADAGPPEASPKPAKIVAIIEGDNVTPIGRGVLRAEREKS